MLYVRLFDEFLRRNVVKRDIVVAPVPYGFGVFLVYFEFAVKKIFQFDLRPVIKRIAESRRKRLAVRDEFIVIARVAGYKPFGYAVITHQSPLIVVAAQPYFAYVFETFVFEYLLFGQMTVIVEYRHILGVGIIKPYRRFVFK